MQEWFDSFFASEVRRQLALFPAVAILGPRQCGKTTLARQFSGIYFDLEARGSKVRLDAEWDKLTSDRRLIILDEAQDDPSVFSRLRGAIDAARKRNGRFLLLGSVSPALLRDVSESLAGRLGLVHMSPFILPELKAGQLDDLWLRGGHPDGGVMDPKMFPRWQEDYLELLVSRDLPKWGLPARPQQTLRLLAMLAAMHGQPLNAAQIGASLGLDHKTPPPKLADTQACAAAASRWMCWSSTLVTQRFTCLHRRSLALLRGRPPLRSVLPAGMCPGPGGDGEGSPPSPKGESRSRPLARIQSGHGWSCPRRYSWPPPGAGP